MVAVAFPHMASYSCPSENVIAIAATVGAFPLHPRLLLYFKNSGEGLQPRSLEKWEEAPNVAVILPTPPALALWAFVPLASSRNATVYRWLVY